MKKEEPENLEGFPPTPKEHLCIECEEPAWSGSKKFLNGKVCENCYKSATLDKIKRWGY